MEEHEALAANEMPLGGDHLLKGRLSSVWMCAQTALNAGVYEWQAQEIKQSLIDADTAARTVGINPATAIGYYLGEVLKEDVCELIEARSNKAVKAYAREVANGLRQANLRISSDRNPADGRVYVKVVLNSHKLSEMIMHQINERMDYHGVQPMLEMP